MKRSEILFYKTEDGKSGIEVRVEGETVWLTQLQMAELFQTTVANVNMHIHNLYSDGELADEATIKEFLIVQKEGNRTVTRDIEFYNFPLAPTPSRRYAFRRHRSVECERSFCIPPNILVTFNYKDKGNNLTCKR